MATKDFETKCAKYVKRAIEADKNYERPVYQFCLNFVRDQLPVLEARFPEGTAQRGELVREALVELAKEQFRQVK